jgi:Ca2+-binding RTX toxin-like protein
MGTSYYNGDNGNNFKPALSEWQWFPPGWVWNSWVMWGRGGNDSLTGGPKDDKLWGGSGNDVLYGGSGGNDKLYGESGNDYLSGNSGNDYLYGGIDNDKLLGDSGNDKLYGESGNDTLLGGSGNDYLSGGDGFDRLNGYYQLATESNLDTLTGGGNADTFILGGSWGVSYFGSGVSWATITDWNPSDDWIELVGSSSSHSYNGVSYSLGTSVGMGNFAGTSATDTLIYYGNDLIAVVQDTTDVQWSRDFKWV